MFSATHRTLRTRREKLAETTSGTGSDDDAGAHVARTGGTNSDTADGAGSAADVAPASRAHVAGCDYGAEPSGPPPSEVEVDERSAGEIGTQN